IVLIFSILISFQSFADCRPLINSRLELLESRNTQTNQNLIVGGIVGGILGVIIFPAGATILGLSLAGSGIHELSKGQLRRLDAAINEAYIYNETGEEGKSLKKLLRKVKRKVDKRITMQDLVDSVIESNFTEEICSSHNL